MSDVSELVKRIDEWDRCYPGNMNIEMLVNDCRSALTAQQAEIGRLREALGVIARQKKTLELETEYDVECADFEEGYDAIIDIARAALTGKEGEDG